MLSAVTLSRSPPRAETTMIATADRSRIWRHSSNPSASGSIRSSSTMSGCSVSSRASALLPAEMTVSKPRTARLERMRSTMFGSSSTMSTFVGATGLLAVVMTLSRLRLLGRFLHGQGDPEAGAVRRPLQLHDAPVRFHDSPRYRQPEASARVAALAASPGRRGDGGRVHQLRWHPLPVVGHPDRDRGLLPGAGRRG